MQRHCRSFEGGQFAEALLFIGTHSPKSCKIDFLFFWYTVPSFFLLLSLLNLFLQNLLLFLIFIYVQQVSEEVERALAKLGPARLNNGR